MTEGPPVDVLPELTVGDEVSLFFDWYEHQYEYKPESPLETEVLDVETDSIPDEHPLPGTVTKVYLSVPESDEKADTYWIEHRVEEHDDGTDENASYLLYEENMLAHSSTGSVGHVDKIEVHTDE